MELEYVWHVEAIVLLPKARKMPRNFKWLLVFIEILTSSKIDSMYNIVPILKKERKNLISVWKGIF